VADETNNRDDSTTACFYCGLVADSLDHVPPQAARPAIVAFGLAARSPFRIVPCCRECNSAMGFHAPWTLEARKRWITTWIARRLGPMLPSFVRAGLAKPALIRSRLAW
jgi:5-methylcytosine-specific restriction endonuclease McrA